jgi:hypothetical protein
LLSRFFAARYLEPLDTPFWISAPGLISGLSHEALPSEITFYLWSRAKTGCLLVDVVRRELSLSEVFVLNKTVEECRETDFAERPGLLSLRAVGEAPALIKRALHLARPGTRTMLFLTIGKVGEVLSQLPKVAWNEPILIPWSRQRVIVLGESKLKCST